MTTVPANPNIEAIRLSAHRSYTVLNQLIDGPLARVDSATLYKPPAAGEWTIMENLAHIVEFMPYWANEIEKLVANPGQHIGRTMQDERRLAAIKNHGADSLEQIKAALLGSYARLEEVLSKLKDSDLVLTGCHIRYGDKPLEWFIEEFVTGHLVAHLQQIERNLEAAH